MIEINTIESRVNFVKDQSVGPGTGFPIKVTLDQLAEIIYRVKDAEFTSGGVSITDANEVLFGLAIYGRPAAGLVESLNSGKELSARGLIAIAENSNTPLPNVAAKFGDAYNVDLPFGESFKVRDVGDSELGLWVSDDTQPGNYWDSLSLDHLIRGPGDATADALSWRTGMSLNCSLNAGFTAPTAYGVFGETEGGDFFLSSVAVNFLPKVAVVGGGGDPFAPDASLYLAVEFSAIWNGIATYPAVLSTRLDHPRSGAYMVEAGFNFKIKLASSTIGCPLYWNYGLLNSGDTPPAVITSSSDFVLTATEWWPYGKGSPVSPVWDVDSGRML